MKPHKRVIQFATAAGILFIFLAYYVHTWKSFTTAFDVCVQPFCDFVDYYYPMGEAIFRTGLPIEGFLYSPFVAMLLAVFPPLGLNASLVVWGLLQIVFVLLYLFLFRRLVPATLSFQLLFVALTLTSFPLLLNLVGGQVGVFMTVALLGMLVLYERGHRAAAACFLAFAVSFKFYPLIFLIPVAARRDMRSLLFAVAACGAFLFVVPGVLLGAGETLGFYSALGDAFRESDWVVTNPHSQYLPHFVLRMADGMGQHALAHLPILRWIGYGFAVVNMGLVVLVQRARLRHADLWSFLLVFLTIPFVLKTSWSVDFIFLSFAQALLAWRLWGGEEVAPGTGSAEKRLHTSQRRAGIAPARMAVTLALLLPSIVFSNIVFFNLFGDFTGYGFLGFLFWADLLLLVALYVELLPPALRRLRGSP